VLLSHQGTLAEQVARSRTLKIPIPRTTIPRSLTTALTSLSQLPARRSLPPRSNTASSVPPRPDLEFFNGLGGFSRDGLEYVIVLGEGQWTPAPWINVIANPDIGFTVSESGSGYTWAQNSRENKLTPWSNDPVSDPVSEAIYIRDEDTLEVFTATPLPIREDSPYEIRHGQGYTSFAHDTHGIHLELTQFVPTTDPVKISRLSLENRSGKPRRLSVTAYLEWVLGTSRESSASHIITELDPKTNAILARNHWGDEFGSRVAFADLIVQWQAGTQARFTCDRSEFIGRHGSLERPATLEAGAKLSGRIGAGLDPCAALQTTIELAVGARIEVVVLLGQTATLDEAQRLISFYRNTDISAVLETVKRGWNDTLNAVRVSTPNRAMDLMLNRWLPYQTLSSRIWARTGFYQAGGAYGFRDQLQDTMALVQIKPDLAREQILRAASRQFLEGDVQHWWHPPSGRGVRTHISDDLVWLPYAISHYLEVSGDARLLDEPIGFIEGPLLEPEQEDSYYTPRISPLSATLFEHGARALEHSLKVGVHGLPLIGSGDWNDGMNRVGREGKGESVWMGWFLHANLTAWAKFAEAREERERARVWRQHAGALKLALETHGWDGDWYKRAFYDDGTPLGSAQNEECRIDSIAQSWAVISGAAEPRRAAQAMAALEQHLVKRDDNLVLLFTPPFEHTERDPGYIKGYLPGVRENGGQYTHAAVWSVLAFAMLGEGDKAFELFSMLNPINRSTTRAGVHRYKVEPYVVSADVYAQEPHVGRGGWTWYTGSSGWLYRVGIEAILGFKLRGGKIEINPCIPRAWTGYQISFVYHSSRYEISIENLQGVTNGVRLLEVDSEQIAGSSITVRDDGLTHRVRVVLG
jgi:cyclic beta-1,2-glucan synthetase